MTTTYKQRKKCEMCETPIPDNFGNLLCPEHYTVLEKDNERLEKIAEEEVEENKTPEQKKEEEKGKKPVNLEDFNTEHVGRLSKGKAKEIIGDHQSLVGREPGSQAPDSSIKDPNYRENPEMPDKDQVISNLIMFVKTNYLLVRNQRMMYNVVKNRAIEKVQAHSQFSKHIWKPHIVDVGCGAGMGSNIMSQEADFVWGIDKNEKSIAFCKEAFERTKNGIYYSSQVSFDLIDILTEKREVQKFDFVVGIEIIEHLNDYNLFLQQIIRLFAKKNKDGSYLNTTHSTKNGAFYEGTEFFISSPNRNNRKLQKDHPGNTFHVREWTSDEYLDVLNKYFNHIELYKADGVPVPNETEHTPLLARCWDPKI